MAEIEVVLEKNGTIEVVNDTQPVLEDEFVHWVFRNESKAVKKVMVEFKHVEYFSVAGTPSKTFSRMLDESDTIYGRSPQKRPFKKVKRPNVAGFRDKYSITTYDAKNKKIATIDPEIVPIRP